MEENAVRQKEIIKVTVVGSLVNLFLLVLKFLAGFLGRSGAMIADAVHSLSDFITDVIVLVFVKISSKPQDETHKYGHGKFETLATAVIGIILFFIGVSLMVSGGRKVFGVLFRGEELQSPGLIALIAALVSIAAKEILYRYTARVGRQQNCSSVVANAWHHRSDAISSIGTALGIGGAILLGHKWSILDPIAAIVVSFLIMKVSVQLFIPAMDELLEKALSPEEEKVIFDIIDSVPGVSEPHNLRTRRIGSGYAVDMHIRVDGTMTVDKAHDLTRIIERRIRDEFGRNTLINLHVEPVKQGVACVKEEPDAQ